ncbi:RNA polymerase sigma-70 factor [Mangrovibacterium sp.]|uniref:RNA polymerase sigma-70 factor n=1 Tax=Mangrovibacterium sp. TaxID=1961364 RepID=UPI0035685A37
MAELNDIVLFHRIKSGDFDAFKVLFDRYYKPLCCFTLKFIRDSYVAEDVVQEVFLKIWEDKSKIKIEGSFKSYLYTAVRNRSLNKLKSESVRLDYTKSFVDTTDRVVEPNEIEQEEFRHFLAICIGKLPPRCQEVFNHSRFDDMKQEKIAEEMNISIKTVKAQIGKALQLIRECLDGSVPKYL